MVRVTEFLRDPRGSMTHTALVFTSLTLLAGGVAVDVMRHENTRAEVQQALDACTMTVAAVEQPGTVTGPAATTTTNEMLSTAIDTCLDRAGIGGAVASVSATSTGGNFKTVTATATGTQTNQFMQMLNIDTLGITANSTATVPAEGKVEVMLAVESSAAINTAGLTTTLKTGAKDFVNRLMNTSGSVLPSVGLVPYSNGVNLTAAMLAKYTGVTNVSNVANSNCINVPGSDFSTVPVLTATAYQTMLMFDLASTTTMTSPTLYVASNSTTQATPAVTTSVPCPANATSVLRPQSDATSTITTQIDAVPTFGGIRWDHGMHWASAMLDPTANAVVTTFVPSTVNTRPLAHNTANLQKVIVFVNTNGSGTVVADGSVQTLATAYTTGLSPIYRNASVTPNLYCISLPARTVTPRFFQPAISGTAAWTTACPAGFTQLTWPQVWSSLRVQWVAWQLYARGLQTTATPTLAQVQATFTSTLASLQQTITFDTQTTQFLAECAAAKAQGIVVFTVGLNAIARAKTPLASCASSPAHYFDATSANFSSVMKTIAQTINQQGYSQ